ncbi:hypothetical protein A1Q1_08237 [Trichosporon asahii var. asahii CBS 2479]|uniref:Uncharacterized protein n=1 Tax=Trichosporon asahii var. asahii (strain ATCC 90039 / CBS 2479 / JCM 2466 / KCTC 7840 / NBRC 103889/ NCYC 2677 / UAMH 7654) TaxID=1186058 RepID=J4UGR8_TRIAS|nr:hypothetical protein A1Q1_08237 [Trichosporon asahii var. asahii CBS 2479]EJT50685.1 hypothetical protein A1Q1_08237 [Trichosporon asahii var. asahii CBS 2479]
MGGGNGAKSAQARARNAAKADKGPTSQLKSNASIMCSICRQTFQGTAKAPMLQQHVDGKHPKSTFAVCFPSFAA